MIEPSGKPIPGSTNAKDVEWALTKVRRHIFRGGQWTASLHAHVDRWLDFLRTL